jgi:hypothetical protein
LRKILHSYLLVTGKGQKQIYGIQIQPLKDPKTGYLTDKAEGGTN